MPILTKWLTAGQRAITAHQCFPPTQAMWLTPFTWLSDINCDYQNTALFLQKPKEQTAVLYFTNTTFPLLRHQTLCQSTDCTLALQNGLCFNSPVLTTPQCHFTPQLVTLSCLLQSASKCYVQPQPKNAGISAGYPSSQTANKTKNLGDGGKCQLGQRYQSTVVPFKILKDL